MFLGTRQGLTTTRHLFIRLIAFLSTLSALAGAFAQTSIPLVSPSTLPKLLYSRPEIERCIILATPESLARAKDELGESKVISVDEKAALAEIIRGVSLVLYPPPPRHDNGVKPVGAKLTDDEGEAFFVDPSLGTIQKMDSLLLTQLVQASQGHIFASGDGTAASSLSELLPALAIFRSKDPETMRSAFEYAVRFEATVKADSVIPGLVQARYYLRSGETEKARSRYGSLLEAHPDLWPARLAFGTLALEKGDPRGAIGYLQPLLASRETDPAFLLPYALSLYQDGRFADAERFVLEGLVVYPSSADLAEAEAQILQDRNEFAKSGPYLDVAAKRKPNSRAYLFLRTTQYAGIGRKDEALKWARKTFQAYPNDPEAMVLLANCLSAGPESGRAEAKALAEAARGIFASSTAQPRTPLATSLRTQAANEATRILLLDACDRQDWYQAASLLDAQDRGSLDKNLVATILRKSGRTTEALDFASAWYASAPNSDPAAEAFLRSLAAVALASAAKPGTSDSGPGILSLASAAAPEALVQPELVNLVLRLLATASSPSMQSFLYYLKGSLSTDQDAAIDNYRAALLARADNVEALLALAKIYASKGDAQKALFYVKQATMLGVTDKDLDAQLKALEKSLASAK